MEDAGHRLTILSRTAIPWSLTGPPAIGLQLVAARGREHLLVAPAAAVERTL